MPDTASITIIKRFPYRGQSEEWSNTYHFNGSTPGTNAAWKSLADAIIASERTLVHPSVQFVRAYGYEPGNEHSVATVDYVALGGTLVVGNALNGAAPMGSGDTAVYLRALRAGRNAKGRNTYCFKYFHGVPMSTSTPEQVPDQIKTLGAAHGALMLGGTLPGSAVWCAPQGQALSVPTIGPWVTTRTLKRRGKRPS